MLDEGGASSQKDELSRRQHTVRHPGTTGNDRADRKGEGDVEH